MLRVRRAAFAGTWTVMPRNRDGIVEALRVLNACRKTAVAAQCIALHMIRTSRPTRQTSNQNVLKRNCNG